MAAAVAALMASSGISAGEKTDPEPFFFALSVADVDASVDWYERLFAFETSRQVDLPERGLRIRLLARPGALLELIESSAAAPLVRHAPAVERRHEVHGVFKFGFLVADLDEMMDTLEREGVPPRGEVIVEPDGTLRSLQVEDPDGNVVQVFEHLSDAAMSQPGRDEPLEE